MADSARASAPEPRPTHVVWCPDGGDGGNETTPLSKSLIGAAIGTAVLAFSAVSASAAIVCTGNVCWHTQETYMYPPGARVIVHPDNWQFGPSDHYTWREHPGRGYWSGDNWTEF